MQVSEVLSQTGVSHCTCSLGRQQHGRPTSTSPVKPWWPRNVCSPVRYHGIQDDNFVKRLMVVSSSHCPAWLKEEPTDLPTFVSWVTFSKGSLHICEAGLTLPTPGLVWRLNRDAWKKHTGQCLQHSRQALCKGQPFLPSKPKVTILCTLSSEQSGVRRSGLAKSFVALARWLFPGVGASSYSPKRLQVQPPVRAHMGGNWSMVLSLSPFLSLSDQWHILGCRL